MPRSPASLTGWSLPDGCAAEANPEDGQVARIYLTERAQLASGDLQAVIETTNQELLAELFAGGDGAPEASAARLPRLTVSGTEHLGFFFAS